MVLACLLLLMTKLNEMANAMQIDNNVPHADFHRRDDDTDLDAPDFSLISDTLNPLTLDFSSNDVEAVQQANTPAEQDDVVVTQIQQANKLSLENVLDEITVNATGAVQPTVNSFNDTSSPLQPRSVQLFSAKGDHVLYGGPDGNFRLVPSDSQGGGLHFKYIAGTVVSDDLNRAMFYYPDMMEKYNVSRFRINDVKRIPKGSRLIALSSFFLEDDSHATFLAADTKGNSFQLLTCAYADGVTPSRVFLAKDAVAANSQLQKEEMQAIMTGSAISGCDYIKYVDVSAPPRT